MAIFAIGDLHLPGHQEKPMNVFGDHWDRHFDVIKENWLKMITPEDTVLIPGDISWAMTMDEVRDDLRDIEALPGKKLILRGNHDYWWSSISKVRGLLGENMHAIQNDALVVDGTVFCGTRGWNIPLNGQTFSEQDEKIYQREILRLEMSLNAAVKHDKPIVVMMHFPPLYRDVLSTGFTDVLERYPVEQVVYGHLHGLGIKIGFEGTRRGIDYHLVSCDALRFIPKKLKKNSFFQSEL